MVVRYFEYGLYKTNASAIFVSYSSGEFEELQRMKDWIDSSFGKTAYSKTYENYQEHLFMFQNDVNNKCLMAAKLAFGS